MIRTLKILLIVGLCFFLSTPTMNSQHYTEIQQKVRYAEINGRYFHDVIVILQENTREQVEEYRKLSTYIVVMDRAKVYKFYEKIFPKEKIYSNDNVYYIGNNVILKKDTCIIK